jgi:hypothetical protein
MYPIWIQLLFVTGGLGITLDLSGWGALDRVLKKIFVVIPHFVVMPPYSDAAAPVYAVK